MNAYFPPLVMLLLRWTLLLALAWGIHCVLRNRHARWRQMLWRGVLVSAVVIAFLPVVPIPLLQIAIGQSPSSTEPARLLASDALPENPAGSSAIPAAAAKPAATPQTAALVTPASPHPLRYPFTLGQTLLILWIIGATLGIARLAVFYVLLQRLRNAAHPAEPPLVAEMDALRAPLRLRRPVDLRISDQIASPFLCGWRPPGILIPAALAAELSSRERTILFAHELAHLRRRDLFWCTAWRVVLAIFWFHPFAWKIPTAHELACEQEADRIASEGLENRSAYARFLARIALQVLAMPTAESRLALSASSQIAGRLAYLKTAAPSTWTRGKSAAACTLAVALLLLAAGCDLTARKPIDVGAPIQFKKVMVEVHDEFGKPIAGAVVQPNGFRVKGIHSPDAYGWSTKLFGPPVPATTNADGEAWVAYPVMGIPEEQELTGALFFDVDRDGFCTADVQTYYIDQPNDTIILKRSGTLDVFAWIGPGHIPVTDLVATLSGGRPGDWDKRPDGHFVDAKSAPGEHVLQLAGKLSSGEMVFSEGVLVTADRGKTNALSVEMKPGIRVEGRIDAGIPRPIANGRVFIGIRPPQFPVNRIVEDYYAPSEKYGGMNFWHTYRTINPDGTFVFESVPPGEADVVAVGDGFTSKSQGEFVNRMPDGSIEKWDPAAPEIVIPQAFPLTAPVTALNLLAGPSATLEVTAKNKSGKPIEGAQIFLKPPTSCASPAVESWA